MGPKFVSRLPIAVDASKHNKNVIMKNYENTYVLVVSTKVNQTKTEYKDLANLDGFCHLPAAHLLDVKLTCFRVKKSEFEFWFYLNKSFTSLTKNYH